MTRMSDHYHTYFQLRVGWIHLIVLMDIDIGLGLGLGNGGDSFLNQDVVMDGLAQDFDLDMTHDCINGSVGDFRVVLGVGIKVTIQVYLRSNLEVLEILELLDLDLEPDLDVDLHVNLEVELNSDETSFDIDRFPAHPQVVCLVAKLPIIIQF